MTTKYKVRMTKLERTSPTCSCEAGEVVYLSDGDPTPERIACPKCGRMPTGISYIRVPGAVAHLSSGPEN